MIEDSDGGKTKRLGDFEIIREIGRGGMGVVYEARQTSLSRQVALKVLSNSLGLTGKAVKRFRREAEAAARLHHTNIVPVYVTGEEQGVHYYAMELVEGLSLDHIIRQMRDGQSGMSGVDPARRSPDSTSSGDLPGWVSETLPYQKPATDRAAEAAAAAGTCRADAGDSISSGSQYFDTVARMIADVADALEHAHKQGVIHRDVKPSNLLLSPDGRLSVNDFGLARMLEQPGMTISGEFVGSPLYMSPEQITAGRAPLDHRTDIYSLGATLYELLTLQPPYPGNQRDRIIAQILHKEVTPPRRSNKRIPRDLETICLKAMDRDPDRRYQTAGAMAEDLRRYVNRHAISAKRVGIVGHTVKWARRHPSLTASLLVTVLALTTAGVLAYSNYTSRVRFEVREAERNLTDTKERAFAAAMAGDFTGAEKYIKQAELLHASNGWVRTLRGQILLHQGKYDEAIDELKHAQDLLDNSTAVYALLTQAYGESGDEDTCRRRIATLRRRKAQDFEDFLFKGKALAFAYPDEALENLDAAYNLNPTSIVVRLLRSRARRIYAMNRGDEESAAGAREDAVAAKIVLVDNPIAVSESIQATLVAANIAKEQGHFKDAEEFLAEADIEGIDKRLLTHSEVRRAVWQYWLCTEQDDKAAEEILRAPLGNKSQDAYLAMLGTIDLYRQERDDDAIKVYKSAVGPVKDLSQFVAAFIQMDTEGRESILATYKGDLENKSTNSYMIFDWGVLKLLLDDHAATMYGMRLRDLMRDTPDAVGHDHLYAFVGGEIGPSELRSEIGRNRSFDCMAYFLLGIEALAAGGRAEARKSFEACVRTDYFNFYAYHLSRAFLVRLKDPQWLPWISAPE